MDRPFVLIRFPTNPPRWLDFVQNGDLDGLRDLYQEFGDSLFVTRNFEQTALHVAVENADLEMVEYLLTACSSAIPIDAENEFGVTAVHLACAQNNLDMLQLLVRHGCDVNACVDGDDTPLIVAVRAGRLDIAQCLVEEGHANVNAAGDDELNQTALHHAVQSSSCASPVRLPMVQVLVRANADPNAKDEEGMTALHYACQQNDDENISLAVVQCLIEQGGADVEATDYLCQTPLFEACENNNLAIVQYLVEVCRASVLVKDECGGNLLHAACGMGSLATLQYLVENVRSSVHATNFKGDTLLHEACENRQLSTVQYLVERWNLDVETTNGIGETALHAALLLGEEGKQVVRYLVETCRANVEATNHDGVSILHMAIQFANNMAIVQYLVDVGHARVDAVNAVDGNAALHVACPKNRVDVARYLLSLSNENNRINIEARNAAGHTPLMVAVRQKESSVALVQCLVERERDERRCGGADTSAVDDNGQTALHYCCDLPLLNGRMSHAKLDVARYLASKSCVEQTDPYGRTALHMALEFLTTGETATEARSHVVGLIVCLVKHLPADFGDATQNSIDAVNDDDANTGQQKRQKV